MKGKIKNMNSRRFGFIKGPENIEYFFHADDCSNGDFNRLFDEWESGREIFVEFEIVTNPKGPRAARVERILE